MLWGHYVAGNIAYELVRALEHVVSALYQSLNNYSHSFAGRKVGRRFQLGVVLTVGVRYKL